MFSTPGAAVRAVNQRRMHHSALELSEAEMWSPAQVSDRACTPYTTNIALSHLQLCRSISGWEAPSQGMLRSQTLLPAPEMPSAPLGCRRPRTSDSSAFSLAARSVVLRLLSIISDLEGGSSLFCQAEARLCKRRASTEGWSSLSPRQEAL